MDVQKVCNESSVVCGDGVRHLDMPQPSDEDVLSFVDGYEKGVKTGEQQERQGTKDGKHADARTIPSPSSLMESFFSDRVQKPESFNEVPNFVNAYAKGNQRGGELDRQAIKDGTKQNAQAMPSPSSLVQSRFVDRMQQPVSMTVPESAPVADMDVTMNTLVEGTHLPEPTPFAQPQSSGDEMPNFVDAYAKGDQRGEELDRQAMKDGTKQDAQVMPSPASLMQSLFVNRMQEPVSATVPESAPVGDMGEAMDKLVKRILVAEPVQGAHEVRLTMGEGMLQGAELSITRHADGQLAVKVSCQDAASFQTAVAARQGLIEALEARGERVQVVVDRGDAGGGNEGDSRQRSKGLQAMAEESPLS